MSRVLAYVWASPSTGLGLLAVAAGRLTGSKVQVVQGVVEASGGMIAWWLSRAPITGGAAAITLGHVILGQDESQLQRCRTHEHVHVRQYERWGPLFIPAYLFASYWIWLRRSGHPYLDNPFEVEAYAVSDAREPLE